MAFWQRRNNNRIYVYTYKDGKQAALSRSLTKHLDVEPDYNIDTWVKQYSEQHEGKKRDLEDYLTNKNLEKLLEQFCIYLETQKRSSGTIWAYRNYLPRYVFPYFLEQELTDPNHWVESSSKLTEHLLLKDLTPGIVHRCILCTKKFYRWLQEERIVTNPYNLFLRNPIQHQKSTPSKKSLTPVDIIKFASKIDVEDDIKLLTLIGYFFSLRPQETFALLKTDFRAGSPVSMLKSTSGMLKAGLYTKFAVNIAKQKRRKEIVPPKSFSIGWVNCFDETAAKMIVELLKKYESDVLFPLTPDRYFKRWKDEGIGVLLKTTVTLKDLRRTSLWYLGHSTNLDIVHLREHARHQDIKTTQLYLRTPEETLERSSNYLDLES